MSIAKRKMVQSLAALFLLAAVSAGLFLWTASEREKITIIVRQRKGEDGSAKDKALRLHPRRAGIVLVDLWNSHGHDPIRFREESFIPRLNQTLQAARHLGMTVFHAVSDVPVLSLDIEEVHRQAIVEAVQDPSVPDLPPFPGNGFFWPESKKAPFQDIGDLSPRNIAIGNEGERHTAYHPDLLVGRDGHDLFLNVLFTGHVDKTPLSGWGAPGMTELFKTAKFLGITHLFYAGLASNQCIQGRDFGMVNMKRLGFNVYLLRDLAAAAAPNGWNPVTLKDDPSMSLSRGARIVTAWIERHFDGSAASSEILKASRLPVFAYTNAITDEPGLVSYWRMDGKAGYSMVQDLMGYQGLWNADKATFQPAGVTQDSGAVVLDGTAALIGAPLFRDDLPAGSPLENLSAGSFTLEAWVRVDGGQGTERWILSHDDGTDRGIDFLLGLNQENRFTLITSGGANRVVSWKPVRGKDVEAGTLFHIAAVQDADAGELHIYVNGDKMTGTLKRADKNIKTRSSLQIGSRGQTEVADGEEGEEKTGAVLSSGHGFFKGMIDEVAVYSRALPESRILEHYELADKKGAA